MNWLVGMEYIFVITSIIIIPLILAKILEKKLKVPWKTFILGAAFFLIIQLIHTPLVMLTQSPFIKSLAFLPDEIIQLAFLAVFLGLLAGLFEEIGRYLVLKRYFEKKEIKPNKENALLFGLGWGFGECVFIGLMLLTSFISYAALTPIVTETQIKDINISMGGNLTEKQLANIKEQVDEALNQSPGQVSLALIERILTLVIQIAFTMIIFNAIILKKKSLLLFAIAFHTFLDAGVVFIGPMYGFMPTEIFLFVVSAISLAYVWKLFKKNNFGKAIKI